MKPPDLFDPKNLNGMIVRYVNSTIHIPLPRALWREIEGGCCCRYCSAERGKSALAYWDTLALSAFKGKDGRRADTTWTVHAPEYHGVRPKREG